MIDYISSCSFPLIEISGIPVPRLILGHLPFLGESYQGPEKNQEYVSRFSNTNNIQKILEIAVKKFGVTVTSTGTRNQYKELVNLHFQAIKKTERLTGRELALIPCVQIPLTINSNAPVDVYRRWHTYYKIEKKYNSIALLERYLEDPILQCRPNWKKKFTETLKKSKPYESKEIKDLQINYEKLDKQLNFSKDSKILFVELGSECDFLAMTSRLDLLSELINYIKKKYELKVLAGVHHAGSSIRIFEQQKIEFDGYVTPINKFGVMMFPNPRLALKSIKDCNKPVIAIKPLAGGRIPPKNALNYIYRDLKIESCMIGIGSETEAEQDLTIASQILQKLT